MRCSVEASSESTARINTQHYDRRGVGFGLFLLLAGGILMAERLGWLPINTDWLLPAILIAWGATEICARIIS